MKSKTVKLTQNKEAIVDAEDYEIISKFKWSAHKENNGYYAVTSIKQENGKYKQFRMHRMILNMTDRHIFIDHKNNNSLDNRKENLRIASYQDNARNIGRTLSNNTSGYRGVSFSKRHKSKSWMSRIKINGKLKHLGYFATAEDAAMAFDKAAKQLFGEFCGKLNFE